MAQSAMAFVMNRIHSTFPDEILRVTFRPEARQTSIDYCIQEDIIKPKVLIDLQSKIGRPVDIPLLLEYREPAMAQVSNTFFSGNEVEYYRIPSEVRCYSNINGVRDLWAGPGAMYNDIHMIHANAGYGNTEWDVARFGLNSRTMGDAPFRPLVERMEDNIIKITPPLVTDGYYLKATVEYDEEFTNCPTTLHNPLADLILIQIKRHVYLKNVIEVDAAKIVGGMELGEYKVLIDRYGEEYTDDVYNDGIDRCCGSNMLGNPQELAMFVSLQLGG